MHDQTKMWILNRRAHLIITLKGGDLEKLLVSPSLVAKAAKFMVHIRLLGQFGGVHVTD